MTETPTAPKVKPTAEQVLAAFTNRRSAENKPLSRAEIAREISEGAGFSWETPHVHTQALRDMLAHMTMGGQLVSMSGTDARRSPAPNTYDIRPTHRYYTTPENWKRWHQERDEREARARLELVGVAARRVLAARHPDECAALVETLLAAGDTLEAETERLIKEAGQ